MPAFRHSLKLLLLLACCYSCKKENTISGSTPHLKKIIMQFGDSIGYTTFDYDSQDRLEAIEFTNNNGTFQKTYISYNSKSYPTKFRRVVRQTPSHPFSEGLDSLIYNNNNQVIEKLSAMVPYGYVSTQSYTYDNIGRLISDTSFWIVSTDISGYTNYSFDANDNIIQSESFYKQAGAFVSSGVIYSSYNNELNPYSSLGLNEYHLKNIFQSKHKIVRQDYPGSHTEYSYEYDNNRLLKKVIIKFFRSNGTSETGTVEFYHN